jgi:CheY-specific phosphatase CheX
MNFAEEEITQLTEMIWQSTLALPVNRTESLPLEIKGQSAWLGTVHITGAWQGILAFQCMTDLARRITQIMFSKHELDVSADEMQDAVGEITNMLGGNVKALLPEVSALSLPAMVEGKDYCLRVPGTCEVTRLVFSSEGSPFVITLLQREIGV